MSEYEKENIVATFRSSLNSIFQEKLAKENWQEKVAKLAARVNIAVMVGKNDKAYLHVIVDNGKISVEPGKLDDANFELAATFETFFNVASGTANPIVMLLSGKLKTKNALKNLAKLLAIQKLLILEKV